MRRRISLTRRYLDAMPATLFERIVAVLMLGASLTLLVLVLREVREDDGRTPAAAATASQSNPGPTQSTSPPSSTAESTDPASTAPRDSTTTQADEGRGQVDTRLLLTATGGDSWIDAREASAQGRVLYAGVLSQGLSVTLRAQRVWVRFGSAANLAAQLNGKPLALRTGTYSALISPSGLQFLGG
jgi:uncharacterized protein DUF4115